MKMKNVQNIILICKHNLMMKLLIKLNLIIVIVNVLNMENRSKLVLVISS